MIRFGRNGKLQYPRMQVSFAAQPGLRRLAGRGLLLGLLALVMILIFHRIENLSYENYVRDLKLDATVKLIKAHEQIENDVFDITLALAELATLVGQDPDMSGVQFAAKAAQIKSENPEVKSIAVAPDQIVDRVYPSYEAEGLLGVDYASGDPAFANLHRSVLEGSGSITGPVELANGVRGLVFAGPVYTRTVTERHKLWGIVTITLDYDTFIERLGIPAFEDEFDLLIQDFAHESQGFNNVLYGDTAVSGAQPISLAFNFPFGDWRFLAIPNGGWPTQRPDFVANWSERALLMSLCLITLWYVMSLLDRRRNAEQLLSTGIEALDHGFVMFDKHRRLVAYNNKYKQIAGGSGMVRIGARYEDIVKANLKEGLIPDAVGREEEWYAEWSTRFRDKEADKEQILADGRLIRAYDRPMADGSVVGLRIDITDLKRAQIAAEAANKAKTDFMGVLSHELRTPLTVILGHAQLAKNIQNMPVYKKLLAELEAHPDVLDDVTPKLDAVSGQIIKMMEALERSGNHLFTLISEILDFAKIDSGTLSMEMLDVTSDEVVEPVIDQMRPMVEDKGLKLELKSETCNIHADAKRIQQVLINLISNASKFTDEGKISVHVRQTEDEVILSVTDTGIGIPDDQLLKVFEAFHQVDNSSGRKYGGTGLGLAISRDIAKAHGGDLAASSVQGEGSTFTLTLPRPAPKAEPEEVEEEGEREPLVA